MRKEKESLIQKMKRKEAELFEAGRLRAEEIKEMKKAAQEEKK